MMQLRPVTAISYLDWRPINGVKVNVILAHELIEFDILRVEPPMFPLGCKIRSYTWVSNRSVELMSIRDIDETIRVRDAPKHLATI